MEFEIKLGVLYVAGAYLRRSQQNELESVLKTGKDRLKLYLDHKPQIWVMRLGTPREDFLMTDGKLRREFQSYVDVIEEAGFGVTATYCEWPMRAYAITMIPKPASNS